jgi:hypothetical protein
VECEGLIEYGESWGGIIMFTSTWHSVVSEWVFGFDWAPINVYSFHDEFLAEGDVVSRVKMVEEAMGAGPL